MCSFAHRQLDNVYTRSKGSSPLVRKPTIHDVATACGLSIATISMALSGRGRISAQTRARVRKVACEMGYRPDPHAALMAKRYVAEVPGIPVALLLAQSGRTWFPTKEQVCDFEACAERRSFNLGIHRVKNVSEWAQILSALYHRGVEGVFFPNVELLADFPVNLASKFSVVTLGHYNALPAFHSVHHEIFHSLQTILRELVSRGYRRILPVLRPHEPRLVDDVERIAAVESLRAEWGSPGPILPPLLKPVWNTNVVAETVAARADAVVAFSNWELELLRAGGIRVPEEVGFAAMHVMEERVSGTVVPLHECTEAAFEMMSGLIRRSEKGIPSPAHYLRIGKPWNEGTTVRGRT